MAFKPNYNHQKMERDRAKQAKKEEKLREKQERKRAELEGEPTAAAEPAVESEPT
jgi:hypothetical protein